MLLLWVCYCWRKFLMFQFGQLMFKRVKSEWSNPCRPISTRFDKHGTSILHNYVPLEIWWINFWNCELACWVVGLLVYNQCKPIFLGYINLSLGQTIGPHGQVLWKWKWHLQWLIVGLCILVEHHVTSIHQLF
jgi:hypothetical protein